MAVAHCTRIASLTFLFVAVLVCRQASRPSGRAFAWKSCPEDDGDDGVSGGGGGICPNGTTCCPTGIPGTSACVPLCASKDGDGNGNDDGNDDGNDQPGAKQKQKQKQKQNQYCKATNETRRLDPSARDTPRYDLCRISPRMRTKHGFPVRVVAPKPSDIDSDSDTDDHEHEHEHEHETGDNVYHLAYYSSVGSITDAPGQQPPSPNPQRSANSNSNSNGNGNGNGNTTATVRSTVEIETAVVVIHGSLRDADDYFCAGLSLIDEGNEDKVMILAPHFASVRDGHDDSSSSNENENENENEHHREFLVWDDDPVRAYDTFLWHVWRYGADAANAPISSYRALDAMVEHLAKSIDDRFPNLRQITVVGHSAGGQMVQRWALLSNSPAWNWNTVHIRAVVANPRSYAYLDDRRWFDASNSSSSSIHRNRSEADLQEPAVATTTGTAVARPFGPSTQTQTQTNNRNNRSSSSRVFRSPVPGDDIDEHCPEYNYWLWGLQEDPNGELFCPYRDRAIYLSGERDTIPKTDDRCGNLMQGGNRHERAVLFYSGLQEYYNNNGHS
eukprot:jgi/Psemu1/206617/e_gw1.412.3.1